MAGNMTGERKPFVLWFTGLSGSGKTTVSEALQKELQIKGIISVLLDGDTVRGGLNRDLGFSDDDRKENIRRMAEIARLVALSGVNAICALISPFLMDRQAARQILEGFTFVEIFVATPLEICEQRDPKGFYKKARIKEIIEFTGIDSIYEKPLNPEITISADGFTVEECVGSILDYLSAREII